MIIWLAGQTKSGKTTLAKEILKTIPAVHLDGDVMRTVWPGLGLSKEDRFEQNFRVARLARMLSEQGFNVIISVICPFQELRDRINKEIVNPFWVWVNKQQPPDENKPFELFTDADLIVDSDTMTVQEELEAVLNHFVAYEA